MTPHSGPDRGLAVLHRLFGATVPTLTADTPAGAATRTAERSGARSGPASALGASTTTGSVEGENLGCTVTGTPSREAHVKLTLDLHDVYNRGEDIDSALRAVIDEAVEKKGRLVEIIPGKGSGQLKKRVLRFLDRKEVKALYERVEKDSHNFGRVFVHFRWK